MMADSIETMETPPPSTRSGADDHDAPSFAALLERVGTSLHTISAALRRRGLWLLFGAIGGIIGGSIVAANSKPIVNPHYYYKATVTLSLIGIPAATTTSDPIRTSLQLAQQGAQTDAFRNTVAEQSGTTPTYVKNHITVIPSLDTASLDITAIDINPDKTTQVAYQAGRALNDAAAKSVAENVRLHQAEIDVGIRAEQARVNSLQALANATTGAEQAQIQVMLQTAQTQLQVLQMQHDLLPKTAPKFMMTGMPQAVRINSRGYYLRWTIAQGSLGPAQIQTTAQAIADGTQSDSDTERMIKILSTETDIKAVQSTPAVIHVSLGLLAGLVLGLSGVVLGEAWDDRIHSTPEAVRASGFALLTEIPRLSTRGVKSLLKSGKNNSAPRTRQAAYRYLEAASVLSHQLGIGADSRPARAPVVLVTSSTPNEGKSTSSAALAAAFAELGLRVLAVDGDYHRNSLRTTLRHIPNFVDPELPSETSIPNVWLLDDVRARHTQTSRTDTVVRLLRRIDSVRDDFDLIVLDTPPMLITADATDFLYHADAVALIVRVEHTLTPSCERSGTLIRHRNVPVTGVIVTDVPLKQIDRNYGDGG